MSRLIDADELRSGLFHLEGETSTTDRQLGYQAGWNDALMYGVLDAPTVDAVKHGHWLFYEEPDGYYHSECSECGRWCDEDVFLKGKWHYCPNCGAKMDEVEDENT